MLSVEQGKVLLFNHLNPESYMWTAEGAREVSERTRFEQSFRGRPNVHLSISFMDAPADRALRYSLAAENIDSNGFDIVFKTWSDSRFARIWVDWIAIGEEDHPDNWNDL